MDKIRLASPFFYRFAERSDYSEVMILKIAIQAQNTIPAFYAIPFLRPYIPLVA